MTPPVLILGAGGHARVLIEALRLNGVPIAGLTDADPALAGTRVMGLPVLGGDDRVFGFEPQAIRLVNGIGSVSSTAARRELYLRFKREGYRFAAVAHPSAVIASDASLGEGVQIMAGAVLQVGVRIEENGIVNTRASVDHDCALGPHVHIAPGVTLSGAVAVGEGVHIGTGATVIQGVTIGAGSTVGAGALVLHDVSEGVTVYGVPAREVAK